MAYYTPEELVCFIDENGYYMDAFATILVGNNNYGYSAFHIPNSMLSISNKDTVILNVFGLRETVPISRDTLIRNPSIFYVNEKDDSYFIYFIPEKGKKFTDEDIINQNYELIRQFLEKYKINTRGKLLKLFRDGYQIYKDSMDITDKQKYHRDGLWED